MTVRADVGEAVAAPSREARWSSAYLGAQAALALVWWGALTTRPDVRTRFELAADHRPVLDAFLVADLVVFVAGSALAAWGIWHVTRWATVVVAFTAGGVTYATVVLAGWVALHGTGGLGLVAMVAATGVTGLIACRTWQARQ